MAAFLPTHVIDNLEKMCGWLATAFVISDNFYLD